MRLGGPLLLLLLLLAPPCADGVGKSKRASKKEKESLLIPLSARNIKDYLDASVPGVVTVVDADDKDAQVRRCRPHPPLAAPPAAAS